MPKSCLQCHKMQGIWEERSVSVTHPRGANRSISAGAPRCHKIFTVPRSAEDWPAGAGLEQSPPAERILFALLCPTKGLQSMQHSNCQNHCQTNCSAASETAQCERQSWTEGTLWCALQSSGHSLASHSPWYWELWMFQTPGRRWACAPGAGWQLKPQTGWDPLAEWRSHPCLLWENKTSHWSSKQPVMTLIQVPHSFKWWWWGFLTLYFVASTQSQPVLKNKQTEENEIVSDPQGFNNSGSDFNITPVTLGELTAHSLCIYGQSLYHLWTQPVGKTWTAVSAPLFHHRDSSMCCTLIPIQSFRPLWAWDLKLVLTA